ncbi:UNVERIFIED_CONTAM: hypothetical protein GTU68_058871 [Idotea baltica]|nr:hypothetical protein [Idotea baltica]
MILGDLGAEIIKVEKPNTGDDTRAWGPPFIGKESCYFFSVNRNKKSIVVDLKKPSGINVIKNIAQKSDVLVENFVPGVMDRLGLGYDSMQLVAPRLIYSSITGYGRTGPYKNRAGYDVLAASIGGLLGVTGPKDGEPSKVGVAMTDLATGLYLHGAIMAALLQRYKTNKGQRIDCDLLSTQVSCMVNLASNYLNAGVDGGRRGTEHESIVPYQAFKTKDGYMTVGAGHERHFQNLCEVLNLPRLLEDERYKTNALRVQNRVSLISTLNNCFVNKTNEEWLILFDGASFPYGPINTLKEAFSDPQVLHNEMIKDVQHPTAGNIKIVGPAVKYSEISNTIRSSPPLLGEHTRQVLMDVGGYSDSEVIQLEKKGIVQMI